MKVRVKSLFSVVICLILVCPMLSFADDDLTIEDFRIYALNETYDDGTAVGDETAFVLSAAADRNIQTLQAYEGVSISDDVTIEFDYYEPSFAGFGNGMYINSDSGTLVFIDTISGKIYDPGWGHKGTMSEENWYSFKIKFNSGAETFTVYGGAKGGELNELFTYAGAINSFTKLVFQIEAGDVKNDAAYVDNVKVYAQKMLHEAIKDASSEDAVEKILAVYNDAGIIKLPTEYTESDDNSEICSKLYEESFDSDEAVLQYIKEYCLLNNMTVDSFTEYALNEKFDDSALVGDENAYKISAAASRKLYTMTADETVSLSGDIVIEFDYYEPSFANFNNGMYILTNSGTLMFIDTVSGKIYDPSWAHKGTISEENWYSFKVIFDSETGTFTVYGNEKGGELSELFTYNGTIDNFTQLVFQIEAGDVKDDAAYVDNVKVYKQKALYDAINTATSAAIVEKMLSVLYEADRIELPDAYINSDEKLLACEELLNQDFSSDAEVLEKLDSYYDDIFVLSGEINKDTNLSFTAKLNYAEKTTVTAVMYIFKGGIFETVVSLPFEVEGVEPITLPGPVYQEGYEVYGLIIDSWENRIPVSNKLFKLN